MLEWANWFSGLHGGIQFVMLMVSLPGMVLVYTVSHMVLKSTLHLFARFFRVVKVLIRGWPPEHLDADGDWKEAGD